MKEIDNLIEDAQRTADANKKILAAAVAEMPIKDLVKFYMALVSAFSVSAPTATFAYAVNIAQLAVPLVEDFTPEGTTIH
jgi:hypothetical protein